MELEVKKSLVRKKKRRKEKLVKDKKGVDVDMEDEGVDDINKVEIFDVFVQYVIV